MLISDGYKSLNRDMHIKKPSWGQASEHQAHHVADLIKRYGFKRMLDYGCGRMRLRDALVRLGVDVEVIGYDPGIPDMDNVPEPQDLVACIDVLEHVEPEYVDAVLDDLKRVTRKIGFFTICTVPANRTLPDGTNPHRTIKPAEWWDDKISDRFKILSDSKVKNGVGYWVFAK